VLVGLVRGVVRGHRRVQRVARGGGERGFGGAEGVVRGGVAGKQPLHGGHVAGVFDVLRHVADAQRRRARDRAA
jgi:hypothetical protein